MVWAAIIILFVLIVALAVVVWLITPPDRWNGG